MTTDSPALNWRNPYERGILRGDQYIIELKIPDESAYYAPAVFSNDIGWNTTRQVVGAAWFAKSPHEGEANKLAYELCDKMNKDRQTRPTSNAQVLENSKNPTDIECKIDWKEIDDTPTAEAQGWQDISTAPKDGTKILTYEPTWTNPVNVAHYGNDKSWWLSNCYEDLGHDLDPTHWMPLPTPPKERK